MSSQYSDFANVNFDPDAQHILAESGSRLSLDAAGTLKMALALLQFYAENRNNELYVKRGDKFFKVSLPQ